MSEQRLRRRLKRLGYRLWKVRDDSRWSGQYGPYSIIDADSNFIVSFGLNIEDVESWLAS